MPRRNFRPPATGAATPPAANGNLLPAPPSRPARDRARRPLGAGAEPANTPARHRARRRAVLDRQPLYAETVGGDRPAGLGLPPMVDDRDTQLLLGPGNRRRVGAFAGQEQGAELPEI